MIKINKFLIFLKIKTLILISFIFFALLSCQSTYNYNILDIKEKTDNEFFSNFYPHVNEDYEFWLFTGFVFDKKNRIFSYSFKLNKIVIEKQIFYILDFCLYDYENKKNYFFEDSSIHPFYVFSIEKDKISLGKNYILWNQSTKFIEINYNKNDILFKLKFKLLAENNFFTEENAENIKNKSFFSKNLETEGQIEISKLVNKKKVKEKYEVKGYSVLYRNFYFTFMDKFEFFFFKIDNHFYYVINIPKKPYLKSYKISDKIEKINISYSYEKVLTNKNRKYGINWDFNIDNIPFIISPFIENNINEGFLSDWFESLVFILDKTGTLKGLGISYLQEFTRDKY
ncbi:MAG: hypothetical protein N3A58_01715 [Spirochaetes bacterium]|nr:hypothetical protein [Spirochaetota bacterium]